MKRTASSSEFNLEALVVGIVLDDLNEWHRFLGKTDDEENGERRRLFVFRVFLSLIFATLFHRDPDEHRIEHRGRITAPHPTPLR